MEARLDGDYRFDLEAGKRRTSCEFTAVETFQAEDCDSI